MTSLKLHRIRSFQELDSIKNDWLDLEQRDPQGTLFQSWEWNRLWCEHVLANTRGAALNIKVIEDHAGQVQAIFPFFKTGLAGGLVTISQFLGHKMSTRNNILISGDAGETLVEKIVTLMIDDLGGNELLHLRHLNSQAAFTRSLIRRQLVEPQCKTLFLEHDPEITDQLTRLGKSSRKALRKAKNRLQKEFGYQVIVKSGNSIREAFDDWYDLHMQRFEKKKKPSLVTGDNLNFLKAIALNSEKTDHFEIISLKLENKTIAAKLLIHDQSRCYAYQSGFNPDFSRYAPARVLMSELLQHAFADLGCSIVDFGPGYEQNKYEWSPAVDLNYSLCLGGPNFFIKSLTSLYRYAFHKNLPPV